MDIRLSRLSMLRLSKNGYQAEKILHAINLMDEACLRLCEGQYLDIANEKKNSISLEEYIEMISGKTAALISCSVKIGALLGTDDTSLIETMYNFGLNLGLAFQIIDDLLGIWGEEEITGKATSDILKKKKTIPVIHTLQTIGDSDRNDLLSVYNKELITGQDIQIAMNILNKARAYEYTKQLAREYYLKSLIYLDSTKLIEKKKSGLKEIAELLIEREY
ncbi:MAG: polyprenyl synthetase family protein [Chloroflexi bacterium]|nr:polyprenyl synthetase family protein [Chloroflexota bacterium]